MSSRLGRSLGLDLLGAKICDFDCLYCEVGRTRMHTAVRDVYVSGDLILEELALWFEQGHTRPGYITLGGMGEPCLNTETGRIIGEVKRFCPDIPVAVLTNSSLLHLSEVRRELSLADAVLPSLDTVVEEEFLRLNRPCPGVGLSNLLEGLLAFRREYTGRIFLETLLVPGYNDSEQNLHGLRDFCSRLSPDRHDLTRMTRPGSYIRAPKTDPELEGKWRELLGLDIASIDSGEDQSHGPDKGGRLDPETVLASLRRRPQTVEQLAFALGGGIPDIAAELERLRRRERVRADRDLNTDKIFFSVR